MNFGVSISSFPTSFGPIMFSGDLANNLPKIADLGCSHVDLFIKSPEEDGIQDVIHALRDNSLAVSIVAAVSLFVEKGLYLSSPDAVIRERMLEYMKKQIWLAAEINAAVPIGVLRGNGRGEHSHEYLARSIEALYVHASGCEVPLLIEPVNRYETLMINSTYDAFDFLERYSLPPLDLLLDTFHMNIEDKSIEDSIKTAGKRLKHLHFADSNRKVPGSGHLNWPGIVKALFEAGYKGVCSFETLPGKDPLLNAGKGLAYARELFKKYYK